MTETAQHRLRGEDAERTTEGDLRALFGRSIAVSARLTGPDHVVRAADAAFFAALGHAGDHTGVPLAELMSPTTGAEVIAVLDRVHRTGEAERGREIRIVLGDRTHPREAYFDLTCEPDRDAEGRMVGIRLIGVETTQVRQAQLLMAEQRALLEQIARRAPLPEVLEGMARCIETLTPEPIFVSVLLADADGTHLHHGAAPSLPDFYTAAIDGIAIGEGVGSCGTAAHRGEPVIVTDIGVDPFWDEFRETATRAGLAACWSTPISGRDGGLLGTFAMYHATARAPRDSDLALARLFADTASLAIERHHIEEASAAAQAQAQAARDELAAAMRAEQKLRADAERRAADAAELAARVRAAASAHAGAPHPEHCQLGGAGGCVAPAEIKIADPWGDSAWGCGAHVEEALFAVRSVFLATEDEEHGGLAAFLGR